MKSKTLIAIALLAASACLPIGGGHTPTPPQPTLRYFEPTLVDAKTGQMMDGVVTANGQTLSIHNRGRLSGLQDCPTPLNVTVVAPGYQTFQRVYTAADVACGNYAPTIQMLANPPPPLSNAGERGKLVRDAQYIRRADGSLFSWVGASDFALFARYLRGEDIQSVLTQRIDKRFNILRVFSMFDQFGIGRAAGTGELNPLTVPDYYVKLRQFLDLVASRGMRVELVVLADADARSDGTGGLLPTLQSQQTHLSNVLAAVNGTWNTTVEWANEAFKNANGVEQLQGNCAAVGVLCAYGTKMPDGPIPDVWPHLDYITIHDHERKDEWPRTTRGLGEVRDALKVPVVGDEPMGFAEAFRPGSRATDANDAAYYAGTGAIFATGTTYHSDDGVASRLWPPVQSAAATAWAGAARWMPAEAQLSPYQRGGECGSAGIGNMPIEHCDLETGAPSRDLRSFCAYAFAAEWCVRIRPVGPTVPRDGWRIVEEPRLGFAKLVKP